MQNFFRNLPYEKAESLKSQIEYLSGQVVSKTIAQNKAFGITLFAIPAGEGISSHKSTGDAFVYIIEGSAEITIDDNHHTVTKGEFIVMPAGHPHALNARENFKMLLFVAFQ